MCVFIQGTCSAAGQAMYERLRQRQNVVCFIMQKQIDLLRDEVEVDHIVPTRDKGADGRSNCLQPVRRQNSPPGGQAGA
jgi:hypothetical protein